MKTTIRQFGNNSFVVQYSVGNTLNLPTTGCNVAVSSRTPDSASSNEFTYTKSDKLDNELFTSNLVETLIDFIFDKCIKDKNIVPNKIYIYETFNTNKDPMWSSPFMNIYIYQSK